MEAPPQSYNKSSNREGFWEIYLHLLVLETYVLVGVLLLLHKQIRHHKISQAK